MRAFRSSLPHCTRVSNGKYANVYHFDNKVSVDDYLRESGIPHSILYTGKQFFILSVFRVVDAHHLKLVFGESLEVQYSCACDRLELTVARYNAQSPQYFTWVERDLNQCALALLKHYKDPESEVLSRTFYAEMDDMYDFLSEFGLYPDTVIPDPRLINSGVKFHTMEEFSQGIQGRYV
ncbi:hypothetical protein EV424DRAFT_1537320 [Suillus variegatus]|nr:hypothetical protein EV424DRAFT_1537320 [Suillus variegatus]